MSTSITIKVQTRLFAKILCNPIFYYAASNVVAHVWLINTLIGSRFIQDLM
ncbi:hypothetical protein RI543_001446 [Arxiozyma heterogenica]|uniref:Uncharacterized protein n=1 Tax=Arxiozyma heterogenica TaxID=278026 RepID=A0AAN7WIY1_9SACH|nr:hypothetical protein RI543_001446 [Kazachstania heterogenica]